MAETTREARFTRDPAARAEPARRADGAGFERRLGLRSATAINMTQMCGIGPFVTIPLMVAALGGPQAVFGWIRRAARACRRPRLGRARRGDGGRRRDVPLPPRGLPVPHRPPHAVPVRLDGDAHHSADHVDGRHRDRPVPRVPRPGDDIARDAPDLAGDRRARAVRPLSADRVDRRDHNGALERRVPVRRHGHRRVADPLRPEPRVHLSEGRVSRSAAPSGRAWAPGC